MNQTTNAQKQNNKPTKEIQYGHKINMNYQGKSPKPRKNLDNLK